MNDDTPKRLYIITVKQNTWQKRFSFEGDDNESTARKFVHAAERIEEISEKHKNWVDFLDNVVENFRKSGFIHTKR